MRALASTTALLIDGNNFAHRAFHATPDLTDRNGRPTGAVHGLASMLLRLTRNLDHNRTIVVWDGGNSGRSEIFPEYKAKRSATADSLKEQWPILRELPSHLGLWSLRVDGYEADDTIGTIAAERAKRGLRSVIATSDRDVMQLVDDSHVRVMAVRKSLNDVEFMDVQAVVDRFGVTPDRITDLYGLKGDTSDNIPGVPGIGEKTALLLLNEFGTLDTLLERAGEIPQKKRRENLIEHADMARMSRTLATIIRTVPIPDETIDLQARDFDPNALTEFCEEYDLHSTLRRILGTQPSVAAPPAATDTPNWYS